MSIVIPKTVIRKMRGRKNTYRFISVTQNRGLATKVGSLRKIPGFLWDPKGVQSRNKNKLQIN